MKRGCMKAIIAIILVFATVIIVVICRDETKIVISVDDLNICNEYYGIIDTDLSCKYKNLLYSDTCSFNSELETHGDEMIKFVKKIKHDIKIAYYDAYTDRGNITTDSIINGLEWMKTNNVKNVNLSLSTSVYNKRLSDWIKDNKDYITIYASYSNKVNSLDYPAMYNFVVGSDYEKAITHKNIDYIYKTNVVIIDSEKFVGNSYLSIISMLNRERK